LNGDLDASARSELERHLQNCEDCRLVVDTTQKTIQIFCNSEPVPLPEDVRARLRAALEKRLRPRSA
jgi:anti-sigma factor RsiW